jgi:hypothetical protein
MNMREQWLYQQQMNSAGVTWPYGLTTRTEAVFEFGTALPIMYEVPVAPPNVPKDELIYFACEYCRVEQLHERKAGAFLCYGCGAPLSKQ